MISPYYKLHVLRALVAMVLGFMPGPVRVFGSAFIYFAPGALAAAREAWRLYVGDGMREGEE